jgi:ankyrin repeat protein
VQREFSFRGLSKPDARTINFPINAEGNTYLHELCFYAAPLDLVKEAVVSLGANMQAVNRKDLPPLALAIIDGNAEIVRCLIDLGAELYFPVGNGQFFNATLAAVSTGREEILDIILKNGGGLYANVSGDGPSCLALASNKEFSRLLEPLAAAGAFVDQESGRDGFAPLHIAATGRFIETLETLLRLGAKIEKAQSKSGMTALHYAVADGNSQAVECLLKRGANPNALTAEGSSPLMLSAHRGHDGITDLLIAAQADVNYQKAGTKETALHLAAARGERGIVEALLKAGADPLLTNAFNQTAARQARETGNLHVKAQLEEAERAAEREIFEKAYKKFRK